MNFMLDQLDSGHRIRVLAIVDVFSRESLALHVGQSIRGYDVVTVLANATLLNGEHYAILHGSDEGRYAPDGWMCNSPQY